MLSKFAIGCFTLLAAGLVYPGYGSAAAASLPREEVEQAVIAAIPAWHGQTATTLKYLDLTQPFATASPWALVVAQDPSPPAEPDLEDHGPIAVCLVKVLTPHCVERYPLHGRWLKWYAKYGGYLSWYVKAYDLGTAGVVYAGKDKTRPLLLLKTYSARSGDGNSNIRMTLLDYDPHEDRFRQVFENLSGGSNNNQAARFVEKGPLQGDVVVDYPTDHSPYTYWIEVYASSKSGQYARILRYRGRTHYGDGNPLPVADSEMPVIMERLGLWKPGDALPVPQPLPASCERLVLSRGEEWCQNLCFGFDGHACSRIRNAKGGTIRGPTRPQISEGRSHLASTPQQQ
jgi:hypothetical protein